MKRFSFFVLFSLVLLVGFALAADQSPDPRGFPIFRGMGTSFEGLLDRTENLVIDELNAGRGELLDRFICGVEGLEDPRPLGASVRKIRGAVTWKKLHQEDAAGLSSRLEKLSALCSIDDRLPATAPKPIVFPRDGGVHLEKLVEWWYYNGQLKGETGAEYGYELCFFRCTPLIYFAHFAVTDISGNRFVFKRQIFSPTSCRISDRETNLAYGDWEVTPIGSEFLSLKARTPDIAINLLLRNRKKPMLVNQTGFLKMGIDGTSYYYSMTRLESSGAVRIGEKTEKVAGDSWGDHQWGNFLASPIMGWDWFCLKLDDDSEYNVFGFHDLKDQLVNPLATVLNADGSQETTYAVEMKPILRWLSPHTGRLYPSGYEISLPEKKASFIVRPRVIDQEVYANSWSPDFIDYWEGACTVEGRVGERVVKGLAYNEICGYPKVRDGQTRR